MKQFFDQSVMQHNSTIAAINPTSNEMYVLDTDLSGGDKFTYSLWMDLATRNPGLMMKSLPVEKTKGQFQLTVTDKENINSVLELMLASKNSKHVLFAQEIEERYSFYFDENQKYMNVNP
ncbi:hypothetical protein [Legionella antarctica]|nr:hypothetical protein [Legionella antarctica]